MAWSKAKVKASLYIGQPLPIWAKQQQSILAACEARNPDDTYRYEGFRREVLYQHLRYYNQAMPDKMITTLAGMAVDLLHP